jgi:hypothetical protein
LAAGAVLVVFGEPSAEEAEVINRLGVSRLKAYEAATVYGLGQ